MIPPIWFVELTRINQANLRRMQLNSSAITSNELVENIVQTLGADKLPINISAVSVIYFLNLKNRNIYLVTSQIILSSFKDTFVTIVK